MDDYVLTDDDCQKIWCAVIFLAVKDASGVVECCTGRERLAVRADAREWIENGPQSGFDDMCEAVGINPDRIRDRVRHKQPKQLQDPWRIRDWRRRTGISCRQLADMLGGVHRETLRRLERGEKLSPYRQQIRDRIVRLMASGAAQ